MNPSFFDDNDGAEPRVSIRARVWTALSWVLSLLARLLFIDLLPRRRDFYTDDGPLILRVARGLFYRLSIIPFLVLAAVLLMVHTGTRPPPPVAERDPGSLGIFFEPIALLSADHARFEAWLVPAVDAQRVLAEGEKAIIERRPAVVLAHDLGMTRQQMLPLVQPLHDAGIVVAVVALRGSGSPDAGSLTFGIREADDLRAVVDMLRRRPYVDAGRVGIVGIGTGASAALLAARDDQMIGPLVLDSPPAGGQQIVSQRLAPRPQWLAWMGPMCKWAFEIAYHVDIDEIDMRRHNAVLSERPVLVLGQIDPLTGNWSASSAELSPKTVQKASDFMQRHLHPDNPARVYTSLED